MEKLKKYREEIDLIDDKIVELYSKRMELVKNIGLEKNKLQTSVTDSSREKNIINRVTNKVDDEIKVYTKQVFNTLFDTSKAYQNSYVNKNSEIKNQIWYMYDELFTDVTYEFDEKFTKEDINEVLTTYFNEYYDENDDKDTWFNKMKELTDKLGYCSNMKEYKENPDNYKGSVADISNIIRVGITTKSQTPDLYIILKLLGKDRILDRVSKIK